MQTTKQKGDIAESYFIATAIEKGYEILKPFGDRKPYDLVIDTGNKLYKIQVKYARYDKKSTRHWAKVTRSNSHKPYSISDFDYAAVYTKKNKDIYIIPIDVFVTYRNMLAISDSPRVNVPGKLHQYKNNWDLLV